MSYTMICKVSKLYPDAIIPTYAHEGDAGADLCSVEDVHLEHGEIKLVKTGISVEIPRGYEAQVRPRSGLALKHGVSVLNAPGTIDAGYRGEVGVILINHGREVFQVTKGMRIAQLVIKKVECAEFIEVISLAASERGVGGFGSTGVKGYQS